MTQISLLTSPAEVKSYLDQVRLAGDSERNAFGFLPKNAYKQFLLQNRMVVAIDTETSELVGYTIFGGTLPQGKIFQTWTAKSARKVGVGRQLVEHVVSRLENQNFLSIRVDVADDLEEANRFYSRLGFEIFRLRPGGQSRKRKINIRVRNLATPSLLNFIADHAVDFPAVAFRPTSAISPLYVIDLNVLFDVAKNRPRASAAGAVMAAAFDNQVRLAVSAELVSELGRHAPSAHPDPIFEFAKKLPILPAPSKSQRSSYAAQLAPLLFPDSARQAQGLSTQDASDLVHLTTAIVEGAAGFITSDMAILRAASLLKTAYGMDVLSPAAFGLNMGIESHRVDSLAAEVGYAHVKERPFREGDREAVGKFLTRLGIEQGEMRSALASGTSTSPRCRIVLEVDQQVRGFASWETGSKPLVASPIFVYLDESSASASICGDHLFINLFRGARDLSPAIYSMRVSPTQPTVRSVAVSNGFFRDSVDAFGETLKKISIGRVATDDNWRLIARSIEAASGMVLPKVIPTFSNTQQSVTFTDQQGKSSVVSLLDLERLFSPVIFALPGRPVVVLPIKQMFAEALFRGTEQPSLLPDREALFRSERGYISKPSSLSSIAEGGIAVFYESARGRGRGAATTVARVTRRFLLDKEKAARLSKQKGVLESHSIERIDRGARVAITEFDNVMSFSEPVSLEALRAIGCADGANFVTAKLISSRHLADIVSAGKPHA